MLRTVRDEIDALLWIIRMAVLGALVGAIWRELSKPPAKRTWNGRLLGFVPYDLRLPTLTRLRDSYFNTRSAALFTSQPVGVGWSVNIAAVLKRLGIMQSRTSRKTD
ncbi:MAG: hypothetical protein ABJB65_00995 [Chloroflexota bacterium]